MESALSYLWGVVHVLKEQRIDGKLVVEHYLDQNKDDRRMKSPLLVDWDDT